MSKKATLLALAGIAGIFSAGADVKVNLPAGNGLKDVKVSHMTIAKMLSTQPNQQPQADEDSYSVKDNSFVIALSPDGPSRYSIDFAEGSSADFFAQPGEELVVDVTSLAPLTYTVAGTPLMEGMTLIDSRTAPIVAEFNTLRQGQQPDPARLNALAADYNRVLNDYIKENPGDPASVYAMLELEGEDFLNADNLLLPGARASILYPIVEMRKPYIQERVEAENRQKALASGTVDAFDFRLKDLQGKEVSLKDYRGKWVILDFWGSWCYWCIKGFPHLKEVYEANKDRLEVIGIDCQESEQAWRDAVAKYDLPWVNLYNPASENGVERQYGLQGFPTKVIVSPEGKIMDITTGDNPDFYTKLESLMNATQK